MGDIDPKHFEIICTDPKRTNLFKVEIEVEEAVDGLFGSRVLVLPIRVGLVLAHEGKHTVTMRVNQLAKRRVFDFSVLSTSPPEVAAVDAGITPPPSPSA